MKAFLSTIGLVLASGAAAAAGTGWQAMDYSDTRHPGADAKQLRDVWGPPDATNGSGGFALYNSKTIALPDGRTAFVSIDGSSGQCTPAANTDADTDQVPTCPVTIVVTDRAGNRKVTNGKACISASLPEDTSVTPGSNATEVGLGENVLTFRAKVGGRYPEDCQSEIRLPAP